MVKLRYNKRSDNCLSLLEFEPQKRTIFYRDYNYSNKTKLITLDFPYLYFLFNYKRVPNGYLYKGERGSALSVFLSDNSIKSLDDLIYCSPTEHLPNGVSCTDHSLDNSVYETPELLMSKILESWFGTPHFLTDGRVYEWKMGYKYIVSLPLPLRKYVNFNGKFNKLINKPFKIIEN